MARRTILLVLAVAAFGCGGSLPEEVEPDTIVTRRGESVHAHSPVQLTSCAFVGSASEGSLRWRCEGNPGQADGFGLELVFLDDWRQVLTAYPRSLRSAPDRISDFAVVRLEAVHQPTGTAWDMTPPFDGELELRVDAADADEATLTGRITGQRDTGATLNTVFRLP